MASWAAPTAASTSRMIVTPATNSCANRCAIFPAQVWRDLYVPATQERRCRSIEHGRDAICSRHPFGTAVVVDGAGAVGHEPASTSTWACPPRRRQPMPCRQFDDEALIPRDRGSLDIDERLDPRCQCRTQRIADVFVAADLERLQLDPDAGRRVPSPSRALAGSCVCSPTRTYQVQRDGSRDAVLGPGRTSGGVLSPSRDTAVSSTTRISPLWHLRPWTARDPRAPADFAA